MSLVVVSFVDSRIEDVALTIFEGFSSMLLSSIGRFLILKLFFAFLLRLKLIKKTRVFSEERQV